MNKQKEKSLFKDVIPVPHPTDLQDCLKLFELIEYKAYGFPMVFLSYSYLSKKWDIGFRNPSTFENPRIEEDTPLEAVHKMFDFLLKE